MVHSPYNPLIIPNEANISMELATNLITRELINECACLSIILQLSAITFPYDPDNMASLQSDFHAGLT